MTIDVTMELITAINNPTENNIHIYPNPGNGIFKLQGAQNSTIVINDIQGHKVFVKSDIENECQIDLSDYESGLYFVKIIQKDGSISMKKIILK